MICPVDYCGGKLRIYDTKNRTLLNKRHHYARCQRCGKKWYLETKVIREVKSLDKKDKNK